jgi:hypothetical protein
MLRAFFARGAPLKIAITKRPPGVRHTRECENPGLFLPASLGYLLEFIPSEPKSGRD